MPPETFVLFDIDGTLLRAGGSGRAATHRAMQEVFGTVGGLSEYRFSGKTDWHTLRHLLVPEGFSEAQIEGALDAYDLALARHWSDVIGDYEVKALPGTRELVTALHQHPEAVLGILTGNMPRLANMKLRAAGFDSAYFTVGVYGSQAPMRRHLGPLAIEQAAKVGGHTFRPEHVVMIGDTLDDIDCAHHLGARIIAVPTGSQTREELEAHPPVTVVNDLADTEAMVNLILRGRP